MAITINISFNIIILLLFIITPLIKNLPQIEKLIMKEWDEHTLFNYIKQKFLNGDKLEDIKNLHYLIADPNEYLKNVNIEEVKNNLESLYKGFNITTFIYIITKAEENTNLGYKLKDLTSEVFSEINAKNPDFDEYSTISAIFRVEDKKSQIRLGSTCRWILSELGALNILKKRAKDLENKKFEKLLNIFTKDILSLYRRNYKISKNYKGFLILTKRIIIFIIFVFLIVIGTICYCLFCNKSNLEKVPKNDLIEIDINSNKEKQIEEFIKKHKENSIETIIENICYICLENYDKENDIRNLSSTSNSDEEDTTNHNINNSISNEKVNIPCGHSFHKNCISHWFTLEKKCPICQAEYEFHENNEKKDSIEINLNIKNYILNENWNYKNENNFSNYINNFIRIQRIINPLEINEEFIKKIINLIDKDKNDVFQSFKINNKEIIN